MSPFLWLSHYWNIEHFGIACFRGATIEVQNIDDYTWLNSSYVPVLKQLEDAETRKFYFNGATQNSKGALKFRNPKYLSMLNHLRFYIPEVFPALNKVMCLDCFQTHQAQSF
jgi:alpha-1,4-galacturonosyltransferase